MNDIHVSLISLFHENFNTSISNLTTVLLMLLFLLYLKALYTLTLKRNFLVYIRTQNEIKKKERTRKAQSFELIIIIYSMFLI